VAADRIILRGGVVGYQIPALRAEVLPLRMCDTLIMATDGIQEHFADHVPLIGEPQVIADRLLAQHRKETDDALVVVMRYLGDDGRDRS
jgi:serine/threonine protein phosphatase PrpC